VAALALVVASLASPPALAEVGGGVSVFTEERFRGQSVSDGHPVASLDLSYDDASGFYLAGSASVTVHGGSPEPVSVWANLGYARNAAPGLVADFGVIHARYTRYAATNYQGRHYTEAYAGVVAGAWSTHVHYSPDYLGAGSTFYADIDATVRPAPAWQLTAHAGLLLHVDGAGANYGEAVRYDLRVAAARRIGAIDLQLAWSGGGPGSEVPEVRHDRGAIVAGASYSF
jgi:uncharacterized protein (TIGR02001 family)